MRIISGKASRVILTAPNLPDLRPTTDRIKESVFASLEPIVGERVVDLFSGSGSLGLEALSRGAESVHMIEKNPRLCRAIHENLARVQKSMGDTETVAEVVRGDALRAPALLSHVSPTLILADPPYEPEKGDKNTRVLLCDTGFQAWAADARLVLELSSRSRLLDDPEVRSRWLIENEKRFRTTVVYRLVVKAE